MTSHRLFLDLDGCINSRRSALALGGYPHTFAPSDIALFDPVALRLIQRLCRVVPSLRIVLSSTWRKEYAPMEAGEALRLPIIASTPILDRPRGEEIAHWLKANPEITTWAILDDDTDMLPEQISRFVHVNRDDGLSLANYLELCALFGVPEKSK